MPSNVRAFGAVSTRPRRIAPTGPAPAGPAPAGPAPAGPAPAGPAPAGPAPATTPLPAPDNVVVPSAQDPIVEQLEAPEQALSELTLSEAGSYPPFAACYNEALSDMPPSILRGIEDRLTRKKYDLSSDDPEIHAAIDKAHIAYCKKREAGRLRSARVRAEKKASKASEDAVDPEPTSSE